VSLIKTLLQGPL